jgi:hypothetical protein
MSKSAWLKTIGTAEDPLPDAWLKERPDILTSVRFPKKPSGIKRGDLLVFYASGRQKLFGLARAKMTGEDCPHEMAAGVDRWAWNLPVQSLVVIPTLPLALDYEVLGKTPQAVMQKSHLRLTEAEYQRFLDALTDRIGLS